MGVEVVGAAVEVAGVQADLSIALLRKHGDHKDILGRVQAYQVLVELAKEVLVVPAIVPVVLLMERVGKIKRHFLNKVFL